MTSWINKALDLNLTDMSVDVIAAQRSLTNDPMSGVQLANELARSEQWHIADQVLLALSSDTTVDEPAVHSVHGLVLAALGRCDESERQFSLALQAIDVPELAIKAAQTLTGVGHVDGSIRILTTALRRQPHHAGLLANRLHLAMQLPSDDPAPWALSLRAVQPNHSQLLAYLAQTSDGEEAKSALRSLVTLQPTNTRPSLELLKLLRADGQTAEADDLLSRVDAALKSALSSDDAPWDEAANWFIDTGRPDLALSVGRTATDRYFLQPWAHYLYLRTHLETGQVGGRLDLAIWFGVSAFPLQERMKKAMLTVASPKMALIAREYANDLANKALAFDAVWPIFSFTQQVLDTCQAAPAEWAMAHQDWGRALLLAGEANLAIDHLTQAHDLRQHTPDAQQAAVLLGLLGRANYALGNHDEADKQLVEAANQLADYPSASAQLDLMAVFVTQAERACALGADATPLADRAVAIARVAEEGRPEAHLCRALVETNHEERLKWLESADSEAERIFGTNHWRTATTLLQKSLLLGDFGHESVESVLEKAWTIWNALGLPAVRQLVLTRLAIADAMVRRNDPQAAHQWAQEAADSVNPEWFDAQALRQRALELLAS